MRIQLTGMFAAAVLVMSGVWAQAGDVENKALVLKMFDLVNAHETAKMGEVIADKFVDNGPSAGGGLEGFKKGLETMHASFPDLRFSVESIVADGDKVAVRGTLSGTFKGAPMFGVAATGKQAKWLSLMTFKVADGKLVERWTSADTWGMLQQIGVLPSMTWDTSALTLQPTRDAKAETANKAAAQELIKTVWMDRKLDGIDKFFAAGGGITAGVPAGGGKVLNPQIIKGIAEAVFKAFPDMKVTVDYVMAEGDTVVLRIAEEGTQSADYMGVPASNKKITWSDTFSLVYKDGKIAQAWIQADFMGLMSKIGGFKPQAGAAPAAGAAMTPAQKNEAAIRRFIDEFWNQRKFDIADQLIAPEHFTTSIPTLPKGPEGMKVIAGVVAGNIFPDLQRKIIQIFATDDMVGAVWENSGTHKGVYMNVPGTGKKVKWTELAVFKMKDGKMVESWYRPDEVGLVKEMVPEKLEWLHF